jgi:hypothetical protein
MVLVNKKIPFDYANAHTSLSGQIFIKNLKLAQVHPDDNQTINEKLDKIAQMQKEIKELLKR